MPRPSRWLLVALGALAAPLTGAAQVGTTTDIITGTVTGPDNQPLPGAVVQATSLETQVSRQRSTDARLGRRDGVAVRPGVHPEPAERRHGGADRAQPAVCVRFAAGALARSSPAVARVGRSAEPRAARGKPRFGGTFSRAGGRGRGAHDGAGGARRPRAP